MEKFRNKMVSNQIVLRELLFFCKLLLLVEATAKDYSKNTYIHGNQLSIINITNVVNISNVASFPVKLELNEETNIEIIHSEPKDNIEYVNNITKNIQTSKGKNNQSLEKGRYGIENFNSEVSPLKYQKILDHPRPNTTTNDGYSRNSSLAHDHPESLEKGRHGIGNFNSEVSSLKYQEIQDHQIPNTTTNDGHSNSSLGYDHRERHTRESQNKTISKTCCLVIYPPKCGISECIIRRKKMCWNVCVEEIVILEAPGFPKDEFPREFIPVNWKNGQFLENITITLVKPDSTGYQENAIDIDNGYQQPIYSQMPYPYLVPQNVANGQYQNINPNGIYNMPMPYQQGYPYFSSYNFEPRPPLYWCPGPYCPLSMRSYY